MEKLRNFIEGNWKLLCILLIIIVLVCCIFVKKKKKVTNETAPTSSSSGYTGEMINIDEDDRNGDYWSIPEKDLQKEPEDVWTIPENELNN